MPSQKTTHFIAAVFVLLALVGTPALVSAADYVPPTTNPPSCPENTPGCDSPIHTGATGQVKGGSVGLVSKTTLAKPADFITLAWTIMKSLAKPSLLVEGKGLFGDQLAVNNGGFMASGILNFTWPADTTPLTGRFYGSVGADKYCDRDGRNCKTSSELGGGFWADRGNNNISNTNTGNVGIGTTNPTNKLTVITGLGGARISDNTNDDYTNDVTGGAGAVIGRNGNGVEAYSFYSRGNQASGLTAVRGYTSGVNGVGLVGEADQDGFSYGLKSRGVVGAFTGGSKIGLYATNHNGTTTDKWDIGRYVPDAFLGFVTKGTDPAYTYAGIFNGPLWVSNDLFAGGSSQNRSGGTHGGYIASSTGNGADFYTKNAGKGGLSAYSSGAGGIGILGLASGVKGYGGKLIGNYNLLRGDQIGLYATNIPGITDITNDSAQVNASTALVPSTPLAAFFDGSVATAGTLTVGGSVAPLLTVKRTTANAAAAIDLVNGNNQNWRLESQGTNYFNIKDVTANKDVFNIKSNGDASLLGGLRLNTDPSVTLPECNSFNRGQFWFAKGGSSGFPPDSVKVCVQISSGAVSVFQWKTLQMN